MLLPTVKIEVLDSVEQEKKSRGDAAFLLDNWRRMTRSNVVISGYISGYLDSLFGSGNKASLPPSLEDLTERFKRGDQVAIALSAVCLTYRLLESQAEADRMNEDLKLE